MGSEMCIRDSASTDKSNAPAFQVFVKLTRCLLHSKARTFPICRIVFSITHLCTKWKEKHRMTPHFPPGAAEGMALTHKMIAFCTGAPFFNI